MAPVVFYLARHGQAESVHPQGDRARALTDAGRAHVADLAGTLRGEVSIRRIVTSPFVRARRTADLWGQALGVTVEAEDSLASGVCNGAQVLKLAQGLGGGVLLVGHNPEMAEAVTAVSGRGVGFPPGSVAAVELVAGAGMKLLWTRV